MSKTKPKSRKTAVSGTNSERARKPKSRLTGASSVRQGTKLDSVVRLLSRPEGTTVLEIATVTGWQQHTVRSVISRALAKDRHYKIVSRKAKDTRQRTYRIAGGGKIRGGSRG